MIHVLSLFAAGCGASTNAIDGSCLPHGVASNGTLQLILQIVFGIAGSIALLVITIAGFRYVVSRGDPNAVAQAKNAILYAIIGLLVAIAAFSIVTFVIGSSS